MNQLRISLLQMAPSGTLEGNLEEGLDAHGNSIYFSGDAMRDPFEKSVRQFNP